MPNCYRYVMMMMMMICYLITPSPLSIYLSIIHPDVLCILYVLDMDALLYIMTLLDCSVVAVCYLIHYWRLHTEVNFYATNHVHPQYLDADIITRFFLSSYSHSPSLSLSKETIIIIPQSIVIYRSRSHNINV